MLALNSVIGQQAAWLALLRAPGIGPVRFARLLARFGTPEQVLQVSSAELAEEKLPPVAVTYLQAPAWAQVEQDLVWLQKDQNQLLTLFDAQYPRLLRDIAEPPPLLFVHGHSDVLNDPQLAIVGARKPTADGRRTAREFAQHLARSGLTITSGLALGIDAESHQGALAADGQTIAVMGTGLDRVYPARNRDLAYAIAESGALVSELPPGTPPLAENFPRRNRIISALSMGTLVVEAAQQSGSLITARLAGEQGREVFAIPGSIHNPMARGCHALIRQGAKLVETAQDILEELAPMMRALLADESQAVAAAPYAAPHADALGTHAEAPVQPVAELAAEYQDLLAHMSSEPLAVDVLVERSGLTVDAVSSMLLILELQGYVTAAPGGCYSRYQSGMAE